jgi:hypothetical protein
MVMGKLILWIALAIAWATPAAAQKETDLLDLSDPKQVAQAMVAAGYKAELKSNSKGEPFITSSTNGQSFTVEFYGCKGAKECGSFQFYSWFKKDPFYTLELVNEWNAGKRFLKLAIDKDGDLSQFMDFTAVGRVERKAFADMIDWYTVMDGDLGTFLKEKRAAAGK